MRFLVLVGAVLERRERSFAVLQRVEQAAMPSFTGVEVHFKAEPTVGIHRFGLSLPGSNRHGANEVGVTIDCPELLLCLRPSRDDPAATHDVAGFHLKNVREIATHHDLKLEAYPLRAVVGDVEILVHAAADRSADDKAEGALRDDAVRGADLSICEMNSRRI